MSDTGDGIGGCSTQPTFDAREEHKRLLEYLSMESGAVHTRLYELECKVNRFERMFDAIISEELERRLHLGASGLTPVSGTIGACEVPPMERLKHRLG